MSIANPPFLGSEVYAWIVLPLLIFMARIIDVSLGTLRVMYVSKGLRFLAPVLGFFEVLIWLLAIGQIMQNLTNFVCYVAYASGFAAGTFVGIYLENKLSIGMVIIRVITKKDCSELLDFLKSENFGVTTIDGRGATGSVKVIFTLIKRQDLRKALVIIKGFSPQAFYSVEDVRSVSEGIFPMRRRGRSRGPGPFLRIFRRG
jgi:uncharacterized protein YebE (UPF0316 family)